MSTRDSYFDSSFIMSTEEHGLKFAFAFTAYDDNVEYEDVSEYGSVKAYYR